jgi:hypothetical protein
MAIGSVNAPGSSSTKLLEKVGELKTAADAATTASTEAKETAESAVETANAASENASAAVTDATQAKEDAAAAKKAASQAQKDASAAADNAATASADAATASADAAYAVQSAADAAQSAAEAAESAANAASSGSNIISMVPTQLGTLVYDPDVTSYTPTWNGLYSDGRVSASSVIQSATGVGEYTETFMLEEGYVWFDGTSGDKSATWRVERAPLVFTDSTLSFADPGGDSMIYTGEEIEAPILTKSNWPEADAAIYDYVSISGDLSGANAGTYIVSVTPDSNHCWEDGSCEPRSVTWTIGKASISESDITLSYTNGLMFDLRHLSNTIFASYPGDGELTCYFRDSSGAEVTSSDYLTVTSTGGKAVKLTVTELPDAATSMGSLTFYISESANYYAGKRNFFWMTNNLRPGVPALNACTPEMIQEVARMGEGPAYWAIGDYAYVSLSGTVGTYSFDGGARPFIIGFDHNSGAEGHGIHFQFEMVAGTSQYMTTYSRRASFQDSNYDATASEGFIMNTSASNSGGWKSSYMATTVCEEFFKCLPIEWRCVIKKAVKYTDNSGAGTNTAACVSKSYHYIWLPSYYEVTGVKDTSTSIANVAEADFQEQYEYYENSAGKFYGSNQTGMIQRQMLATETLGKWWLRSPAKGDSAGFALVSFTTTESSAGSVMGTSSGTITTGTPVYTSADANYSYGFAPCFVVA